jgi:hypothetical protein
MDNTEKKVELKFIEESKINIYWPSKTDASKRLVKLSSEEKENYSKVMIGDETFASDVLLNVESDNDEQEVISFNIRDLIKHNRFEYDQDEPFELLGDILFIDGDNNHGVLSKGQYIRISNHIFYMPNDIYLAIDLNTGDIVFKNAPKSSELHIKYLSLFLLLESDYKKLEEAKIRVPLSPEEREALTLKAIDGYDKLTDTQKEEVKHLLDKILYDHSDSDIDKFKIEVNKSDKPARIKVPIKDDGTVDIDLFTDEICPQFAEREIDMANVEFETNGIVPFITETDIRNLSMLGFSPKDTKNIIRTMKETLIDTSDSLNELNITIDGHKKFYDNSYSTCLALISNNTYNSKEYDQTIKNNYTPLAMMLEYENRLNKEKDVLNSAKKTLASFQYISRQSIARALENGEFTNKHTFAALAMFYKSMLGYDCVSSVSDNYGVYVAYLKYLNKKYKELGDTRYFDGIFSNSFDPGKDNNIYSITKDLMIRFVRINDLSGADDNKQEWVDRIILRVQERIDYLYGLSYYPINIAPRACTDMINLFSFTKDLENDDFYKKHCEYVEAIKNRGWPIGEIPEIDSGDRTPLLTSVKSLREKLDNPEIIDSIKGFLKMMWFTVLTKYVSELMNKSYKNKSDVFKSTITNSLVVRMVRSIEIITTGKIKDFNEKNEDVVVESIDEEALKAYIGKFLIELACYTLFTSLSLRLNNLMVDNIMNVEKLNETDAQSFFSVILNGLIIPIEVIENATDKNNAEENASEIDTIISEERKKYLGVESTKIFYNGLKGMTTDEPVCSRLLMGRREMIKESIIFSENVLDIVNRFIDELTPREE